MTRGARLSVPRRSCRVWRHPAQIQRVGKFYIEKAVFAADFSEDPVNGLGIARIPVGGRQRLRRMIGRVPKEFVIFALYLGWVHFKELPVVNFNQQKTIVHLDEQRVTLLTRLVNTPLFHGRIVHAE